MNVKKKAMLLVVLVVFIVQNKNSKKEKKSLCQNSNSYTNQVLQSPSTYQKTVGREEVKNALF